MGISWIFASHGHHKTVGAVEKVKRTLMSKIRKISDYGRKNWEA